MRCGLLLYGGGWPATSWRNALSGNIASVPSSAWHHHQPITRASRTATTLSCWLAKLIQELLPGSIAADFLSTSSIFVVAQLDEQCNDGVQNNPLRGQ